MVIASTQLLGCASTSDLQVHTFYTALLHMIDFDTNDFEYLQALVVEEYMAEFLEDLAEDEQQRSCAPLDN